MGKITVKHYLNTNLKPYMVRGEAYYTIYILITVNRKTTNVPSKDFAEYNTENEFEEYLTENAFAEEAATIENLIRAQLDTCEQEFDTVLFSALYNLMPNYCLVDTRAVEDLFDLMNEGDFDDSKYMANGFTFSDWFTPRFQNTLLQRIELSNARRKDAALFNSNVLELNKAVVIGFFEIICVVARSMTKYRSLKDKHSIYSEDAEYIAQQIIHNCPVK